MANILSSLAYFIFVLWVSDMVIGQIRYSVPEEQEIGSFVGSIAEDLRISVRELLTRKFQLLSDEGKQYFEVNVKNGVLFVHERIDREQLCMESSTCFMLLEIALENPLAMFPVEVEILDVNDNSPIFPTSRFSLLLSELVAPGSRFPLESAHDPDVGSNTISTYLISLNEYFSLKIESRNDGGKIAELLLEKPLDRELCPSFELVLTAIDGGTPQRSGTIEIIITVTDVNDNAPLFDHETYSISLLENTPKGTLVMKLNASDSDEGTNAQFRYSFSNYASHRVRELFHLDAETGEIRVQSLLDYEQSDVYELNVQAVDNAPNVGYAKVLVRIIDVNDNAPELKLTSLIKVVSEDVPPGSVILVFGITDRDSGENGRVRCQIPINVPFKLQTSFPNRYKLVTSDKLDRETTALYNISISARDAGSPALSTNQTIVVSISDINDNAPRFTQSSYNVYRTENNAPGTSIFSVTALDPDLDKNGDVSYSILENQIEDATAPAFFTINAKSGCIFPLLSFDYEQLKNLEIKVQAQDGGSPSLSSTAIVKIIILDQNDNPPLIVSPLRWNSSAALVIMPRSIYSGYLVTKVTANDADSGQNAWLSYELIEATDMSLFTVGFYSGEIRATRSFIGQDSTTQRMVVLVKDNGHPRLSSTVQILLSTPANGTDNTSERIEHPTHAEYFSDLNIYLITLFGSTSFIFLAIIILLIVLKCKHNQNNTVYQRPAMYCMRKISNDVFNRRPAPNESLNYYGAPRTLPASDAYSYQVHLSPESSKSDFLFLKACRPALPLSDETVNDTSVS